MKKFITQKQIRTAIRLCWKLKIPFAGNFIFGDVAETTETAKVTLDFWKKYCKGQIKLFFIHPYPNSEIYQHCLRKGLIKDKLDFIKNGMHHTNILNMTDKMTDKEFNNLKKEVFKLHLKYDNYVIPSKLIEQKKNIYDIHVKCPFCKKEIVFRNHHLPNTNYYQDQVYCRECQLRFHFVSRLYRFTIKHYVILDALRKVYLKVRDKLVARTL